MANFFIDRPIFAWVIAILIMMAGTLAIVKLPVQQYPTIAPPSVTISATYPGSSAKTLEESVTQVIEQSMTGLDNLLYMSSQSTSTGHVTITLTFAAGTDPDIAQVQVQNKLAVAQPLLPEEVQRQGIAVNKGAAAMFMVIALRSSTGAMTRNDISDYGSSVLKEPLSRVNGVGDIMVFGSPYAMRIWLLPQKLTANGLTPLDVREAIAEQNIQTTPGQLGGMPAVAGQQLNFSVVAQTRMESIEEFENILLKVNQDGSQVRLKDVAEVALGSESYENDAYSEGKPVAGLRLTLASGANALETAKAVRAKLDELAPFFPEGLEIDFPFDTAPFVKISIEKVVHTLVEAVILVFLVMYLFLGNLRATIIPTIAVPVVLLGTFGVMAAFGFSINTLTMFGMVLAIGLLVDDAIIVVENVERIIAEERLSPREATRKSMRQITGALVGIAMVLSAVFVPMAFFGGSTGAIYRQFSVTIVSAMLLSVVVAIILTPALCATFLQSGHTQHNGHGFFARFNNFFNRANEHYSGTVTKILPRPKRLLIIYLLMFAVMALLYVRMPTSFLPEEDQAQLVVMVQLPAGASIERTVDVMSKVDHYFQSEDAVKTSFMVSGFSFAGQGQNMGFALVKLKDWSERNSAESSVQGVINRAFPALGQIKDAMIFPVNLPPIIELGTSSGFDVMLLDHNNRGHEALMAARNQLLGLASQDPRLARVRPNGMEDVPTFRLDIDYEKVRALGIEIKDVNDTLSMAWGSNYVNDFMDRGRVKRVYIQAKAPYRMMPSDLEHWYVNNDQGQMVPMTSFITSHWEYSSPRLERYNGIPAVNIQGQAAPGYSTGDAMAAMEDIARQLPNGYGLSWTGMSLQERLAGDQAPILYAISLLVVFLSLAALYESWSLPFTVILVVPLGILGALLAATLRGLSNDIYFQVGLLTTMGLSAKNAILIVEFAKTRYESGEELIKATVFAAKQRLRPIIMTSMAFICGVTPLALSTGAGAVSRQAIGTGVIGGMLAATFLAIFFVPLFYVLVVRVSERLGFKARPTASRPVGESTLPGEG